MADPSLIEVDHDPWAADAPSYSYTPIEHDPFSVTSGPIQREKLDFTEKYNTRLPVDREKQFQAWVGDQTRAVQADQPGRNIRNDLRDYDLRGYYQANPAADLSGGGHLTDTYKKPNHPTFSNESQYHGQNGMEGGAWEKLDNGSYTFRPSATNLQYRSPQDMRDYFKENEPGNRLLVPVDYDPFERAAYRTSRSARVEPDRAANLTRAARGIGGYAMHVGEGLADWVKTPGEMYQAGTRGEPFDLQRASEWGAGTALGMMGTGTQFAKPGSLGTFGGAMADTANGKTLRQAQEMHANGIPREDIWHQTGWFQGADQRWRFEIPDYQARVPLSARSAIDRGETQMLGQSADGVPEKLGVPGQYGVLRHEPLYAAYPELREIPIESGTGEYPDAGGVSYGGRIGLRPGMGGEGTTSVALHEVQHEIQHREGFAKGSNPQAEGAPRADQIKILESEHRMVSDADILVLRAKDHLGIERDAPLSSVPRAQLSEALSKAAEDFTDAHGRPPETGGWMRDIRYGADPDAHYAKMQEYLNKTSDQIMGASRALKRGADLYRRSAGEVEARNVQARAHLTPEELKDRPPWTTEDVPREQQIVRSGLPGEQDRPGRAMTAAEKSELAARDERAHRAAYTIDAYHGTQGETPFQAFRRRRNDIGIHFGTAEQANDRIGYMAEQGRPTEGSRVIPVKLKIRNPLRMDDLGGWNSDNMRYGLERAGFPKGEIDAAIRSSGNEAGRTAALRRLIERKGYDGIIYKNTGETGGSEPFRREAQARWRDMLDAFGYAENKRQFSYTKEQQAHPAYQAYQAANDAYRQHRKLNAQDSYIAFHPEQVRSRFAKFEKPGRDISASTDTSLGSILNGR